MDNVSRPMIALLIGTVAFFALWMVALKPSSSTSGKKGGVGQYQSAINKAKQAVAASAAASAAQGGNVVTTPASTGAANTKAPPSSAPTTSLPATTSKVSRAAARTLARQRAARAAAQQRIDLVTGALEQQKVVALLFYNAAAADDRAVKQELAAVPAHGRQVVKVAVPIADLSRYRIVTTQVPVEGSPTLVLIDRQGHAGTLVGFADRFEIAQRVADSLKVK